MDNLYFEDLSIEYCNQVFDIERQSISEPWSREQIQGLVTDKNAVARVGIRVQIKSQVKVEES